jgi:hypothetical protein
VVFTKDGTKSKKILMTNGVKVIEEVKMTGDSDEFGTIN